MRPCFKVFLPLPEVSPLTDVADVAENSISLQQTAVKLLGSLTICKRAGLLIMGFDVVKEAVGDAFAAQKRSISRRKYKNPANAPPPAPFLLPLVLVASDISAKSFKEVGFFSNPPAADPFSAEPKILVRQLPLSKDQIWASLGKKAGVIAILDMGFAKAILAVLDRFQGE